MRICMYVKSVEQTIGPTLGSPSIRMGASLDVNNGGVQIPKRRYFIVLIVS